MGQHSFSRLQATAPACVISGADACAVARAVQREVNAGIVLPAGPYRYPYAALVHLLRLAGLFQDPAGETATDPVLSREALTDLLRQLLPRGVRIGLVCADRLDHASAELLGAFAATARLALAHGLQACGLVIGTLGHLPEGLQGIEAELRSVPGNPEPSTQLSPEASRLLSLLAGAPHPVLETSLLQASGLPGPSARAALRELAAAELVDLQARLALGPATLRLDTEPEVEAWADTPEVRLPHARLAVARDPMLALHLGRQALIHDEPELAAHCFAMAETSSAHDRLLEAVALVRSGAVDAGLAVLEQLRERALSGPDALQRGVLAALLAEHGRLPAATADALLRKAERAGATVASVAWRARLLVRQGAFGKARNLLRRTRRAELAQQPPDTRIEHALAEAACLAGLGDRRAAESRLQEAAAICTTRGSRRRLASVAADSQAVRLAADDLDATALAAAEPQAVRDALGGLFAEATSAIGSADDITALFDRLHAHGATLLAALVGEELELRPPAAHAHPGLAARLESKLRQIRAIPQAVVMAQEDLTGLGAFSGRSQLVLHSHGAAGPLLAVFKGGSLPPLERLLGGDKP